MTYLTNQIDLFKKSFKLDKKRFLSVISFDFVFLLASYVALFLCGMWLSSSASKISGLDLTNLTENAVNELAALKSFYYGAIICLILLVIFLFFAWSFFQGFIWNTILKKKFNLDYFKKFLLLNLAFIPLSIILLFIAAVCFWSFNSVFLFFSATGLNKYIIIAISLVLFTFVFLPILLYTINFISILYIYFTKKSKIMDSFNDTFRIAVKKIHLLYIPYLIISLAFVFLAVITIPLNILPLWLISLVSFVLLVVYAAWARFYIAVVITELERIHHKI